MLACGAIGYSLGQHRVDYVVSTVPKTEVARRISLVSMGSREASGNLLLAGTSALAVLLVGGVLALRSRDTKA